MKFSRRNFLHLAVGAAVPALSRTAWAQAYPGKPVRMIVGFAAGGPTDIVARLMAQRLSERLVQPFIIENRPGAAGNIATEAALKASPDGQTLLFVSASNAVNVTLYEKANFNFIRDIAPVAGIIRAPFVMEVNPSVPATTVPEFIAYAKANPGKLNFASGGNGSSQHLCGELFKMVSDIDMVHVPYRGSAPAAADLIGGQVQLMFDNVVSSIGYIKAGTLRALAVTDAVRSEILPDVPTAGDFLPGYEATAWAGLVAPRNTPVEIVDRLNQEINLALADPKMKMRLADLGGAALAGSPADFERFLAVETEKWGKVVKFAGIKPG